MIPCKRPKVTIEPHEKVFSTGSTGTYHLASCHVPGCGWSYDAAVVTDAQDQATWHRMRHRASVPATKVVREVEWEAHCTPCGGHRRTFGTKKEAQAWLDEHLATEHGLVSC